jgi:hypothetical protein
MTRRDYNRFAEMLRFRRMQLADKKASLCSCGSKDCPTPRHEVDIEIRANELQVMENEMIELFKEDNPNFKPDLFRKAAAR